MYVNLLEALCFADEFVKKPLSGLKYIKYKIYKKI